MSCIHEINRISAVYHSPYCPPMPYYSTAIHFSYKAVAPDDFHQHYVVSVSLLKYYKKENRNQLQFAPF